MTNRPVSIAASERTGAMTQYTAQEIVERAGGVHGRRPDRLRGRELEANLRWAGNSLTTNGAMRSRQVVVVSFVDGGSGMAAGTVSRTGTPDIGALVAASEQAARDAGPAEDAVPLVTEKRGDRGLGRRSRRPPSRCSPTSRRHRPGLRRGT